MGEDEIEEKIVDLTIGGHTVPVPMKMAMLLVQEFIAQQQQDGEAYEGTVIITDPNPEHFVRTKRARKKRAKRKKPTKVTRWTMLRVK